MRRLRSVTWLFLMAVFGFTVLFWNPSAETGKPVVINNTPVPPVPTPDPARVAQGVDLYAQYCATCHGADLEGAPDWKKPLPDGSLPPPPHDGSGHTWHHPDSLLARIIANGGDPSYNSKMPAFDDKIALEEIGSIMEYIKSKWGKDEREYQWWITKTQSTP